MLASTISGTKFLFVLIPPCGRVFDAGSQEHDPIRKANVEIRCDSPSRCPACGATEIRANSGQSDSKLVYDLKFTRTGVKRWVIRYYSQRRYALSAERPSTQTRTQQNRRPDMPWQAGRSTSTSPSGCPSMILR